MPWLRNEDAALKARLKDLCYTSCMNKHTNRALAALRAKIDAKDYFPDGRLGRSYPDLRLELGVPEKALSEALQLLADENAILVRKGKGIFIANRPDIRYCPLGKHYVALRDFGTTPVSAKNPEGRQAYCKPCAKLNSQLRYHNMQREDYDRMLAEQQGLCAICHAEMDTPQIDHDHTCCPNSKSCGKCTRALLCVDCNFTLGWSRDNPDRLIAAATYVLQHREVVSSAVALQ